MSLLLIPNEIIIHHLYDKLSVNYLLKISKVSTKFYKCFKTFFEKNKKVHCLIYDMKNDYTGHLFLHEYSLDKMSFLKKILYNDFGKILFSIFASFGRTEIYYYTYEITNQYLKNNNSSTDGYKYNKYRKVKIKIKNFAIDKKKIYPMLFFFNLSKITNFNNIFLIDYNIRKYSHIHNNDIVNVQMRDDINKIIINEYKANRYNFVINMLVGSPECIFYLKNMVSAINN